VDPASSLPSKKGGHSPQLFARVCCDQTVGWIKMPLGTEAGLGPGHIVLVADPGPPKNGHSPHFSALVYCGQTAGWIKRPFSTKVSLSPGYTLCYMGTQLTVRLKKGHSPSSIFGPCLLSPNGRPSQLLLSACSFTHGKLMTMMMIIVIIFRILTRDWIGRSDLIHVLFFFV